MGPQQGRDDRTRPAPGCLPDCLKRLYLGFNRQSVTGFGLHCCRALSRHFTKCVQNSLGEFFPACLAHGIDTGLDTPSGFGDLLISGTCDTLLKVKEASRYECGMSVRIHETGKHNVTAAVDLHDLPAVLSNPGIAHRVSGFATGDNFAARTEHCTIFNDGELTEIGTATWARFARERTEREQLANVDEKKRML